MLRMVIAALAFAVCTLPVPLRAQVTEGPPPPSSYPNLPGAPEYKHAPGIPSSTSAPSSHSSETSGHPAKTGTQHNYIPAKGYVPDEKTAIAIAVAVAEPIYGVTVIQREKPFHARRVGGIWKVEGTLNGPDGRPSTSMFGGVVLIEIQARTGRILRVTHGR